MAYLFNGKLTLIGTFGYADQSLIFHFPVLVHAASQSGSSFPVLFPHLYTSNSTHNLP